ncbi:MAG: glycosyltransferase family 9 protein, partial [Deltaproteobacteria bacterium]|nr:glycosyltransferase family 9 protein [Deltaproteobacteria bacterium]
MTVVILELLKLGDFIQSTPLISSIKEQFKRQEIIIAAHRADVALAAEHTQLADRVVAITDDELSGGSTKNLPDQPKLLVNLSSAPAALNFASSFKPKEIIGPRLTDSGQVKFPLSQMIARSTLQFDRSLGRMNLVDMWRLMAPFAVQPRPLIWPLVQDDAIDDELNSQLKRINPQLPTMGLHLGCGHHLRRWSAENFAALAKSLGLSQIVLLGGPHEKALAMRFMHLWGEGGENLIDLSGKTSLPQLGLALSKLDLFVSADTGVMHMAAAVGAPV